MASKPGAPKPGAPKLGASESGPAGSGPFGSGTGEPDPALIEAGRKLFAGPCDFVFGAASPAALPAPGPSEIAFAGRSNVGKSSLINALTGRNSLARVSRTPGRTQQINFFSLAGRLVLVDLPGYGFARAPKKRIAQWSDLIYRYLKGRTVLRRVLILVDARHGLKDSDRALFDFLDEAAMSYQVVLTKADALRGDDALARAHAVGSELAGHVAAYPEVAVTSAESGTGIAELRATLAAFAA